MAALYGLEDVRAYEAMTLRRLAATFPLWCIPQPIWFNRVDDPTKPFLSFLNVRYFLAPPDYGTPPGWHTLTADKAGILLENERVLPRAFIPRRLYCEDREREQLLALGSIRDFREAGVAALGCALPTWMANANATATILAYEGGSLTVSVSGKAPTVLATSIPAWPGWQVAIDRRRTSVISYNHAFLGVPVPAGDHVVTFRYLPRGFLLGCLITGLSAAAILICRRVIREGSGAGAARL